MIWALISLAMGAYDLACDGSLQRQAAPPTQAGAAELQSTINSSC
jgi:hypothetical protein